MVVLIMMFMLAATVASIGGLIWALVAARRDNVQLREQLIAYARAEGHASEALALIAETSHEETVRIMAGGAASQAAQIRRDLPDTALASQARG